MQNSTERRELSRGTRLDDQALKDLTDKVADELRVRQSTTTRREGR